MATTEQRPADTTMMRIVHQALRRDLRRAQEALAEVPPPSPERMRAIAAHLDWMMTFLRAHHLSEDEGVYALVRERAADRPDVLDVLDRMDGQHDSIAPAIDGVSAAAATIGADGGGQVGALAGALEALASVLLPHLDQEEADAMPVVSALVTDAEWGDLEQRLNLDPKSFSELGHEGHWLIDDVSDADRATVLGLVPPVPRFLLVHGFARGYRRRKEACWGQTTTAPARVQKHGRVVVEVDADIDAVWQVVSDVTRVGEWSHECVGASWVGGSTGPVPGARFRGRNRAGLFRWGRVCEIVDADPYRLVWRTVPTTFYPDSSEWTIELTSTGAGTTIEQRFRALRVPKVLDMLYARLIPTHRDRNDALADDLRRLGAVAGRPDADGRPTLRTAS